LLPSIQTAIRDRMSRKCLAIRADASVEIGIGHVRRCLSLATALRELGAECMLVFRDLGIDVTALAAAAGVETAVLPAQSGDFAQSAGDPAYAAWACTDWESDAEEMAAVIKSADVTMVVVDHYAFDARWHRFVRKRLDCPIAAIDDLGDRSLDAEFIIDHNWSKDPYVKHAISLRTGTHLLTGPRFALIDPAYATASRYTFSATVRSIGIFMGGVDALGLSLPIAGALRSGGFTGTITIATTSANPRLESIVHEAGREGCKLLIDQSDLAPFFAAHDLQIGASGGATWERCCIGAPTLACIVADNQREVLTPLRGLGVVEVSEGEPRPEQIAAAALALMNAPDRRRSLAERARELVDGRGAERVAREILAL